MNLPHHSSLYHTHLMPCKEIQRVHPKWDQSWVFIGRTDAEAETPILWPPHTKRWVIGKDPDAGRDWGQEEKGMTEDEVAGWHHRLDGQEFGWTLGVGDGQGGLVCYNSWGHKESDTTERRVHKPCFPSCLEQEQYLIAKSKPKARMFTLEPPRYPPSPRKTVKILALERGRHRIPINFSLRHSTI